MILVSYRQATPEDLPFVYATWLKNARRQGDHALMTNTVYYNNESIRLKKLIESCQLTLICNPDDMNHIYAWACYVFIKDLLVIHYCYVKKSYRKLGIMSDFFHAIYPRFTKDQTAITHINEDIATLREPYKLAFNPYIQELLK